MSISREQCRKLTKLIQDNETMCDLYESKIQDIIEEDKRYVIKNSCKALYEFAKNTFVVIYDYVNRDDEKQNYRRMINKLKKDNENIIKNNEKALNKYRHDMIVENSKVHFIGSVYEEYMKKKSEQIN